MVLIEQSGFFKLNILIKFLIFLDILEIEFIISAVHM